jgi:hypothetical protein
MHQAGRNRLGSFARVTVSRWRLTGLRASLAVDRLIRPSFGPGCGSAFPASDATLRGLPLVVLGGAARHFRLRDFCPTITSAAGVSPNLHGCQHSNKSGIAVRRATQTLSDNEPQDDRSSTDCAYDCSETGRNTESHPSAILKKLDQRNGQQDICENPEGQGQYKHPILFRSPGVC